MIRFDRTINPKLIYFVFGKAVRLMALLLAVASLSYALVTVSPIDPVDAYLGPMILKVSPEKRALIEARWGMDQTPLERYGHWAQRLLHGDMGVSTIFNEPVHRVIIKRFATSFWLMLTAWVMSGIFGFFLGIFSGTYENSILDKIIGLYAYVMASTPTFWVGMVLLAVFSIHLDWAPVCCAWPIGYSQEQTTVIQRIHHLMLPAFSLSLIGVAQITLHTREKTIAAMNSDYALFARVQGEKKMGIAFRHALRNISLPALTLQFASLGELFGGAVLAEQVFLYPGLGKATVDAGYRGDIPLLLGIVLFSSMFVFAGNTIADLSYRVIDPRMRFTKGVS